MNDKIRAYGKPGNAGASIICEAAGADMSTRRKRASVLGRRLCVVLLLVGLFTGCVGTALDLGGIDSGGRERTTDTKAPVVADETLQFSYTFSSGPCIDVQWNPATDDVTAADSLSYTIYYSDGTAIDSAAEATAHGTTAGTTNSASGSLFFQVCPPTDSNYINVVVADEAGNQTAYAAIMTYTGPLTGTETAAASDFSINQATHMTMAGLGDGGFVIAYRDKDDSNHGKFVVYDAAGTEVVSTKTFHSSVVTQPDVAETVDGNFIFAFTDANDGQKGKIAVFGRNGTTVTAAAEFDNYVKQSTLLPVDGGEQFVLVFNEGSDLGWAVYDKAATLQAGPFKLTPGGSLSIGQAHACRFSNGNILLTYNHDDMMDQYYRYAVVKADGTTVKAQTDLTTGSGQDIGCAITGKDEAIYFLQNSSSGVQLSYVLLDSTGTVVQSVANVAGTTAAQTWATTPLSNGNAFITYRDNADTNKGKWLEIDADTKSVVASGTLFDVSGRYQQHISAAALLKGGVAVSFRSELNGSTADSLFLILR